VFFSAAPFLVIGVTVAGFCQGAPGAMVVVNIFESPPSIVNVIRYDVSVVLKIVKNVDAGAVTVAVSTDG
jgi:hypothetical protein